MSLRALMIAVAGLALLAGCAAPGQGHNRADLYAYRGIGCHGKKLIGGFEKFVGRKADGVVDFVSQESWTEFSNSGEWLAWCWKGTGYRLALAVPMLPFHTDGTLKRGAAGEYDARFRKLAEILVKTGHAKADLRIGWEFNGNWYPWAAKKDPENFVAYFRRIVRVMRSVKGQQFRINWNPNLGTDQIAPDRVYPGDDVVDVIAADIYNSKWNVADALPRQRWNVRVYRPYGLNWLADFARKHNKPIAIPEWGTGTRPDGHGAGDDPLFIKNMADWIAANNVVYHGYWDVEAADFNAQLSNGKQPQAAAEFKRRFGGKQR